jgi:hypothetical protein
MRPLRLPVAILASTLVVAVAGTGVAQASPGSTASTAKVKKGRVGGKVDLAWPYSRKGRPADPLAQWLAKQSGPACPKHRKKSHCPKLRASGQHKGAKASEAAVIPSIDRAPRHYDADPVARIASPIAMAAATTPLALTRSYDIPSGDPSYSGLLNWAWTYDSAVTASSFMALNNQTQAKALLDQLTALQRTDGSIDIAFNVSTGQGAGMYRTGTIAWVGLAMTKYDGKYNVSTYRTAAKKAADYLLTMQSTSGSSTGLIRGGPGLPWYSTQHNILAYEFIGHLALELGNAGDTAGFQKYGTAAAAIGSAIQSNLLTGTGTSTHFIQGFGDSVVPLDAQAYGALFEIANGNDTTASSVLTYAKTNLAVTGRSIVKSTNAATYNNTYAAAGPYSGYKPYLGDSGPNVLWFAGTPMLRMVTSALGQSTTTLDSWITSWKSITASTVGPLQADQTLTNAAFGVEYHVWPSAEPAAWILLSQNAPTFFTSY